MEREKTPTETYFMISALRSSFFSGFTSPLMLIRRLKNSNCCLYSTSCAGDMPDLIRRMID